MTSQKPDQWLASKFKGTDVMGSDNKKIGDVSDILFDKSGEIEAFVASVGGFLGMGAKEVALAPSSFEVVPGQNASADKLTISMSQDELKQAQNFARYEPPRPSTTVADLAGCRAAAAAECDRRATRRRAASKPVTIKSTDAARMGSSGPRFCSGCHAYCFFGRAQ